MRGDCSSVSRVAEQDRTTASLDPPETQEAALGGGDEHARSALTIPRAVHPPGPRLFFSFFFFFYRSLFSPFHFTFFPRVSLSYRLGSVPGERTGKKFKYPKISKYPWCGGGGGVFGGFFAG